LTICNQSAWRWRSFRHVVAISGSRDSSRTTAMGPGPGIFRKTIIEADPAMDVPKPSQRGVQRVSGRSTGSATSCRKPTRRQKAQQERSSSRTPSAAAQWFSVSGAFAMACHAKWELAQSMARELMQQVSMSPRADRRRIAGLGGRKLARTGWRETTVDDKPGRPHHIAETYLQLHSQHRSMGVRVVRRPWVERW